MLYLLFDFDFLFWKILGLEYFGFHSGQLGSVCSRIMGEAVAITNTDWGLKLWFDTGIFIKQPFDISLNMIIDR